MAKKQVIIEAEETSEQIVEEQKQVVKGFVAIRDINKTYRKGNVVPNEVVAHWKSVGFHIHLMVEEK